MQGIESAIELAPSASMPASVYKAIKYMLDNFSEEINLDDVAMASDITKFNLCRNFQRRYGLSPMKWLWTFRTMLAAEFIQIAPAWSLTDIAFLSGFSSSAHFSRSFCSLIGSSPSRFRKYIRDEKDFDGTNARPLEEYGVLYQDNTEVVKNAYERMLSHIAQA